MNSDLTDNFSSERAIQIVKPIDWGLAFAMGHKRFLITLAVLPIAVELCAEYIKFVTPLPPKQQFLVAVCSVAANAWLLSAIVMACIEKSKGLPLRMRHLLSNGLRYLPKIFFSYIVLMTLLPVLFLVLFFIWAPFYCIGECYSKPLPKPDPDDEYDPEPDDEPPLRVRSHFTGKSIWELGFSRSLQFASQNFGITLQLALLFWFAKIIPIAAVDLVTLPHAGFFVEMLKFTFSSFAYVLVLAATAGTFLFLLPNEAKKEIGIDRIPTPNEIGASGKRQPRVQGRYVVLSLLVLFSFAGTFFVINQMRLSQSPPDSVRAELVEIHREESKARITVRLSDRVSHFRWMNPGRMGLQLGQPMGFTYGSDAKVVDAFGSEENDTKSQGELKNPPAQVAPIGPSRYVVIGEDGKELPPDNFKPYYFPLKLVLYYDLPESLPKQESFVLKYVTEFEEQSVLARGSFGFGW